MPRHLPIVLAALVGACGPRPAPTPAPASATPAAPASDAAATDTAPATDTDGDGITDGDDLCPDSPMVMSAGCAPAQQRGCPDDCRAPTMVAPP